MAELGRQELPACGAVVFLAWKPKTVMGRGRPGIDQASRTQIRGIAELEPIERAGREIQRREAAASIGSGSNQ